jgi:hypothetical protein
VWLSWKMIRLSGASGDTAAAKPPRGGFVAQGALVALGNPKTLLFFGAFFPQFIDPARDQGLQFHRLGPRWSRAFCRTHTAPVAHERRVLIGGALWLALSRR